jgi:hypothetical protein
MSRSAYLNLYATEDKTDNDKRVAFAASNADFDVSGAQDAKFDFNSYQFSKMESGSKVAYNLETRFTAIENDNSSANNAAAISQLQVELAGEQTARISADTSNANNITSEISARTGADQVIADALDVQEAKQVVDDAARSAAITQEISDRQAAVSAEAGSRASDVAGLQNQIASILSNVDPALIDSLAELLSHVNAADASLIAAVAASQAKADANEARLDELLNQP